MLLNTLCMLGATGASVYLTSPSRSYGAVHKFPWQNVLHNLPNHVFDARTPYRNYSFASRFGSFFAKVGRWISGRCWVFKRSVSFTLTDPCGGLACLLLSTKKPRGCFTPVQGF